MPHSKFTPLMQNRTKKTVPITTRVAPGVIDQIEATACSLGIPRHHILKAALRLGTPLAIAELTAGQPSPAAPSIKGE